MSPTSYSCLLAAAYWERGALFFHQLECLSMHTVHSSLWPPSVRMPYKAVNFQILWVSFQNPKIMCKIFSGFLIGRGFYLFGRSFFFPCTKTLFLSRVISPPFQYLLSIPFPFSPLKIFPLRPADSRYPLHTIVLLLQQCQWSFKGLCS